VAAGIFGGELIMQIAIPINEGRSRVVIVDEEEDFKPLDSCPDPDNPVDCDWCNKADGCPYYFYMNEIYIDPLL